MKRLNVENKRRLEEMYIHLETFMMCCEGNIAFKKLMNKARDVMVSLKDYTTKNDPDKYGPTGIIFEVEYDEEKQMERCFIFVDGHFVYAYAKPVDCLALFDEIYGEDESEKKKYDGNIYFMRPCSLWIKKGIVNVFRIYPRIDEEKLDMYRRLKRSLKK